MRGRHDSRSSIIAEFLNFSMSDSLLLEQAHQYRMRKNQYATVNLLVVGITHLQYFFT